MSFVYFDIWKTYKTKVGSNTDKFEERIEEHGLGELNTNGELRL